MSHQNSKPITSVDEMKNMHNEYNNVYYWSNDFVNQLEAARGEGDEKEKQKGEQDVKKDLKEEEIDPNFDYEEWLEENLWKYYD